MFLRAHFSERTLPWRPGHPLYKLHCSIDLGSIPLLARWRRIGDYRLGRLCNGVTLSSHDLGKLIGTRDEIDRELDHVRPKFELILPPAFFKEHGHVMAGIGHGKSLLLQRLIARWLPCIEQGLLSVVVIDSQRDLIRDLTSIKAITNGPLGKRTLLLDGSAMPAPAISPFSRPARWASYGAMASERIATASTDALLYAVGALFGRGGMTAHQSTLLAWALRALSERPNPTLRQLLSLLDIETPNPKARKNGTATPRSDIKDRETRAYFEALPMNARAATTASEVKARLYGVMAKPAIARLFNIGGSSAHIDLFEELAAGSFVLIDTAKDALGSTGSGLYGRLSIAMLSAVVNERLALPKEQRKPVIVVIDECADYLASNDGLLIELLTQARKANVALILAHQHLGQLQPEVAAAVLGNVGVMIHGALSHADRERIAPEIAWTPDELSLLRKLKASTTFALWSKAHGRRAIKCGIPLAGIASMLPLGSREDLAAWHSRNRDRTSRLNVVRN